MKNVEEKDFNTRPFKVMGNRHIKERRMNKKIITLFELMVEKGIILSYALGGGVAVKYYVNPPATIDIDFFVIVRGEGLDFMSPIYKFLLAHGAKFNKQNLIIYEKRLDILPAFGLTKEAVLYADIVKINGVNVRIIKPDYLAAMLYFVGRKKDDERITMMINKGLLTEKFTRLVTNYGGKI
jgi:hypothetical protein